MDARMEATNGHTVLSPARIKRSAAYTMFAWLSCCTNAASRPDAGAAFWEDDSAHGAQAPMFKAVLLDEHERLECT